MKKRKAAEPAEEVPSWVPAKTESLGFGPEDRIWTGDDGNLDPEALLREHGWHPETPLEAILRAMVDANSPPDDATKSARIEKALAALTGTKVRRGADQIEDYDLLTQIAHRYWEIWCSTGEAPDIAPLARAALAALPADDSRLRGGSEDSRTRRLVRKFDANRDLLLARLTLADAWNSRETATALRRVIEAIRSLGIQIADANLRRTESKAPY